MAGTIIVDRIESDASYASSINVAAQVTFSNTVNFGAYSGTAPVAGFYLPTTNNLAFTTASTERMRIDSAGNVGIGTNSPAQILDMYRGSGSPWMRLQSGTGAVQGWMQAADSTAVNLGSLSSHPLNLQSAGTTQAIISTAGVFSFNSGYGSAAAAYGCRAWANFNGTGTVAIRGSGNVSSITDNGTGDYTINFTTAMPDANYSTVGTTGSPSVAHGIFMFVKGTGTATTASNVRISTVTTGSADYDFVNVLAAIFR